MKNNSLMISVTYDSNSESDTSQKFIQIRRTSPLGANGFGGYLPGSHVFLHVINDAFGCVGCGRKPALSCESACKTDPLWWVMSDWN